MLSHPLAVEALVSRYLTNKLIAPRPLLRRNRTICSAEIIRHYPQFPVAIPDLGARNYALLSLSPLSGTSHAALSHATRSTYTSGPLNERA